MCIVLFCVCMCLYVHVCFYTHSHSKRHTHAHTHISHFSHLPLIKARQVFWPLWPKDSSRQARPLSLTAASSHWGSSPNGFLEFHKYGSCSHAFMPLHIWCPPPECFSIGLTPLPVFRFSSSTVFRKAPLAQPLCPIWTGTVNCGISTS